MRHFIRAAFILLSMSSNNALSKTTDEAQKTVKIENYNFEFEQTGGSKPFAETSPGEDGAVIYNSITLSYTLKQDNIVESPTLLESLKKAAEEKCNALAGGSLQGKIISKEYAASPWKIKGNYLCAFE